MSYQSQIPIPPQERERQRAEEEQRRLAEEELSAYTGRRYEAPPQPQQEMPRQETYQPVAPPQQYQRPHQMPYQVNAPAPVSASEERTWAMCCHLATFSAGVIPFGSILGPLIVWLMKKDQMALVNDQGKEALNFQITIHLLLLLAVPLTLLFGLGVFLAIGVAIMDVVCTILAAVAAYNGQRYRYPMTLRFLT